MILKNLILYTYKINFLKGELSMFKNMRRQNKLMEEKKAKQLLEDGDYGVYCTIGENGYPYGVPLNYVYMNGSIYFHCATEGHKIDNMNYCDKTSFTVVHDYNIVGKEFDTHYESIVVYGRSEIIDGEEKRDALIGLINKYSKDYIAKGIKYIDRAIKNTTVVKINIEHITGKHGE